MRFLGLAWPASLLNWFAPLRGAGVPPFGLGLAACSVFGVGLAPFVFWGWVALPLFSFWFTFWVWPFVFWGWLAPLWFLGSPVVSCMTYVELHELVNPLLFEHWLCWNGGGTLRCSLRGLLKPSLSSWCKNATC